MAEIIYGGNLAFDAMMFHAPSQSTIDFMAQTSAAFQSVVTAPLQNLFTTVNSVYDRVNYSEGLRLLRAAGRAANNIWRDDMVRPLYSIGEFQHAPSSMIRFIMAQPDIRKLYHQGMCEGYGDRYTDLYPDTVGEAHYDYRRAVDGMVLEQPDGTYRSTTYFEDVDPNESLDIMQQTDIMQTFNYAIYLLDVGKEDPTSPSNARL